MSDAIDPASLEGVWKPVRDVTIPAGETYRIDYSTNPPVLVLASGERVGMEKV